VDFFLFLILNGVLFLRPEELFPSIAGLQLYYWVICINLIVAFPALFQQFEGERLKHSPITACVIGMLFMVMLSHIARFDLWSARVGGFEFLKVVLYFLLLVSVVNSTQRLIWFFGSVIVFALITNILAVLQYHGYINIEALTVLMELDYDEMTGERFETPRMRATGIFNDPNDLSMIIVASLMLCSAGLFHAQLGPARFLLLLPMSFFIFALRCTQSRGGLLALAAGLGAMVYAKYGWKKAVLTALMASPLVLLVGGRQADLAGAMSGGTGEARTELWSESLQLFKQSPLFGIGYQQYSEVPMQVAHNSFVHSTTELGFFGGMVYLGAFAIPLFALGQLIFRQKQIADPQLRHLLPFVFGLLVAYSVSMLSLSRCYVVPTYLVAGVAAVYLRAVGRKIVLPTFTFNRALLARLAFAQVAMLVVTYLYIVVAVRLG
jgi:hypothetical protein